MVKLCEQGLTHAKKRHNFGLTASTIGFSTGGTHIHKGGGTQKHTRGENRKEQGRTEKHTGGHRNTQGRTQKDRGGGWIGIYPYFKPSLGYQPPLPMYPRAFLALAAGIKVVTQNAAG